MHEFQCAWMFYKKSPVRCFVLRKNCSSVIVVPHFLFMNGLKRKIGNEFPEVFFCNVCRQWNLECTLKYSCSLYYSILCRPKTWVQCQATETVHTTKIYENVADSNPGEHWGCRYIVAAFLPGESWSLSCFWAIVATLKWFPLIFFPDNFQMSATFNAGFSSHFGISNRLWTIVFSLLNTRKAHYNMNWEDYGWLEGLFYGSWPTNWQITSFTTFNFVGDRLCTWYIHIRPYLTYHRFLLSST